jgi:hypothetical protein
MAAARDDLTAISEKQEDLLGRGDQIERTVNNVKVPAPFADQSAALGSHIAIDRAWLMNDTL